MSCASGSTLLGRLLTRRVRFISRRLFCTRNPQIQAPRRGQWSERKLRSRARGAARASLDHEREQYDRHTREEERGSDQRNEKESNHGFLGRFVDRTFQVRNQVERFGAV